MRELSNFLFSFKYYKSALKSICHLINREFPTLYSNLYKKEENPFPAISRTLNC